MKFLYSVAALFALVNASSTPSPATSVPAQREVTPDEMEELFAQLLMRDSFLSQYSNVLRFRSAPRGPPAPAEPWVSEYVTRILAIATTPESVIADASVEAEVRKIGREINEAHGHEGMVAVCESNRRYKAFIERAWNGIGTWLA